MTWPMLLQCSWRSSLRCPWGAPCVVHVNGCGCYLFHPPPRDATLTRRPLESGVARMATPSPPTCELDCGGGGWVPRGEGCFFLQNYTGGLYMHPCELPFGSLPPMFLAAVFSCLLGLMILAWQCNRKDGAGSESASPKKDYARDYSSPGFDAVAVS